MDHGTYQGMAKHAGPHNAVSRLMCRAVFLCAYGIGQRQRVRLADQITHAGGLPTTHTHIVSRNGPLQPPGPLPPHARRGGRGCSPIRRSRTRHPETRVLCVVGRLLSQKVAWVVG